jgi:predicted Zn finger-like uncharacterized protein
MIVVCPSCGIQLNVPEELLGRTVKCASCANTFSAGAGVPPPENAPPYPERRRPRREVARQQDEWEEDASWSRGLRRDLAPHRGGMVLTLGIVSVSLSPLSFCSLPGLLFGVASLACGIPALVMGHADLRRMDAHRMDPDGRGMTNAGWICGIVGICISGLATVLIICLMLVWGSIFWRL